MSKNILIVSNTPFYGGGETFVRTTLSLLENIFFIVRDVKLAKGLEPSKTILFTSDNLINQVKEVRRCIKAYDIDTVILNGGQTIYFSPFLRKQNVIIYRHTTNKYVVSKFKRFIYTCLLHLCYAFADKVIHVSNYSRQEQKLFKSRASTIHNGVSDTYVEQIKEESAPLKLLFLGRVDESKGIKDIVKAVKQFTKEQVVLDIVGTGTLSDWAREQSNEQVTFHGFQSDVDKFYRDADAYIMLSHFENCPFTIIDAMKWGIPVIATPVGGIPELIDDGVTGYLISRSDDIYDSIYKLVNDPDLRASLGKNGREKFLRSFTIEKCLYSVKAVISEL